MMVGWNYDSFKDLLPDDIVGMITAQWIDPTATESDGIKWMYSSDGNFLTKSGYEL